MDENSTHHHADTTTATSVGANKQVFILSMLYFIHLTSLHSLTSNNITSTALFLAQVSYSLSFSLFFPFVFYLSTPENI